MNTKNHLIDQDEEILTVRAMFDCWRPGDGDALVVNPMSLGAIPVWDWDIVPRNLDSGGLRRPQRRADQQLNRRAVAVGIPN